MFRDVYVAMLFVVVDLFFSPTLMPFLVFEVEQRFLFLLEAFIKSYHFPKGHNSRLDTVLRILHLCCLVALTRMGHRH